MGRYDNNSDHSGLLGFGIGLTIIVIIVFMGSCTNQSRARNMGGEQTIELEPNMKLVNISWVGDGDNLWYLTEPMEEGYTPQIKEYREKDSFTNVEGIVTIIESRLSDEDLAEYKDWKEEIGISYQDYKKCKELKLSKKQVLNNYMEYGAYYGTYSDKEATEN